MAKGKMNTTFNIPALKGLKSIACSAEDYKKAINVKLALKKEAWNKVNKIQLELNDLYQEYDLFKKRNKLEKKQND